MHKVIFKKNCQHIVLSSLQHDLLNTPDLKCMSSEIMVGADKDMASGVMIVDFTPLS